MKKKVPVKAIVARKKSRRSSKLTGNFESLVASVVLIRHQAQEFATKAVNVGLTLRNWLIGRQIEEYELNGSDRAAYGDKLMDTLAKRLVQQGWKRCDRRELYRFRQLYLIYPEIVETLSPQFGLRPDLQPLLDHLRSSSSHIRETLSPAQMVETVSPQSLPGGPDLLHRLAFSHLSGANQRGQVSISKDLPPWFLKKSHDGEKL